MRTPIHTILGALLAVGLLGSTATADLTGPRTADQRIVLVVSKLIQREHIAKPELNDEISRRVTEKFVQGYDPFKLYFTKPDVDEFNKKNGNGFLWDDVTSMEVAFDAEDPRHCQGSSRFQDRKWRPKVGVAAASRSGSGPSTRRRLQE